MQLTFKITQYLQVSTHVKEQIEILASKIDSENLIDEPNSNLLRIIQAMNCQVPADVLFPYFINLLSRSMKKDRCYLLHHSHLETLKCVGEEEIHVLKILKDKSCQFIRKSDLDRENNRFTNHHWEKFEFPKEVLKKPDDFYSYENFLRSRLKLVQWPVYKQDGIWDSDIQTGLMEYSQLSLTDLGRDFVKNILSDED